MKKQIITTGLVIGLLFSTTALRASDVSASEQDNKTTQIEKDPQELGVVTSGALNVSGSGANGLQLQGNNSVTTGELDFHYTGKSIVSIGVNEQTETVFSVPKELQEIVNDPSFNNYVSGTFQFNNGATSNYDPHDIRVEDGGATIRVINPNESWVFSATFDVHLNFNLGQMVTDTGMRVPDAENNSSYIFNAGLIEKNSVINWDIVNKYNTSYTLPTHQLDPGWGLLHRIPTAEDVYDVDTTITGEGEPGAKIQVKVGDEVIGEGTVDSNGIYEIEIPKQNVGVTINVIQNTGVGWSDAASTIVKHKNVDIKAPVVTDTVYDTDTVIKGTGYEIGNTIIVTDQNGNEIGRGLVGADKTFKVTIDPQKAYTILHLVETNGTETSPATEVTVHEGQNNDDNEITSINPYSISNNDGFIYGTYSGNNAVSVRVNIDAIPQTTVGITPGNGNFKYYVGNLVTNTGQAVSVSILDGTGNAIDTQSVTILP
ncbi:putative secreted protein [Weissella koreensis KACC 15510]|uniref:Ig-like domain-containing protein n=1 Tax=Weissella koreensis TaxID=165096 RepID=UPI00021753AA|nr:Ig-like domain-containing protein [Weissella koreensis]AEJ23435.1 putative secreted protein [Weissella koreensis KACC 15510]